MFLPTTSFNSLRHSQLATGNPLLSSALLASLLAFESTSRIMRFLLSSILLTRYGFSILMLPCSAAMAVSCQIATISQFFGPYSTKTHLVFDPDRGYWRTTHHGTCVRYSGRKPNNNRRPKNCRHIAEYFCAGNWLDWAARACTQTSSARQTNG